MKNHEEPSVGLRILKREAAFAVLQQTVLMMLVGGGLVPKVVPLATAVSPFYKLLLFFGTGLATWAFISVIEEKPLFIALHIIFQLLLTFLLIVLTSTSISAIVYRLSDDTLPDWTDFLEGCLTEAHCQKLMQVAKVAVVFTLLLLIWLTATAAWRVFSYCICMNSTLSNKENNAPVVKDVQPFS